MRKPPLLVDSGNWTFLAGVPKEIIARLSAECTRILKPAKIRECFARLGTDAVGGTPEELAATIQTESARWGEVVRKQHITMERSSPDADGCVPTSRLHPARYAICPCRITTRHGLAPTQ